jgi:hypothetical protein
VPGHAPNAALPDRTGPRVRPARARPRASFPVFKFGYLVAKRTCSVRCRAARRGGVAAAAWSASRRAGARAAPPSRRRARAAPGPAPAPGSASPPPPIPRIPCRGRLRRPAPASRLRLCSIGSLPFGLAHPDRAASGNAARRRRANRVLQPLTGVPPHDGAGDQRVAPCQQLPGPGGGVWRAAHVRQGVGAKREGRHRGLARFGYRHHTSRKPAAACASSWLAICSMVRPERTDVAASSRKRSPLPGGPGLVAAPLAQQLYRLEGSVPRAHALLRQPQRAPALAVRDQVRRAVEVTDQVREVFGGRSDELQAVE